MAVRKLSVGLFASALLFAAGGRTEPASKVFLNGKPAPVFFNDGDSFRVLDGELQGSKARLAGFNTLETFGPVHRWGDWTSKELAVLSKMATLNARRGVWNCESELEKDTYGRILWLCKDLAIDQVRKGLAHALSVDATPADPDLLAAQREAIENRRGMWAKGVPALVLTSLHSTAEGGGRDGRTYNRAVSSVDGHSQPWIHTERYGECQEVCVEVRALSAEHAALVVSALSDDEEAKAYLEPMSADARRRWLEALWSIPTDRKDSPLTTRVKAKLQELTSAGTISPAETRKDSCHIYVDFRRRYGGDKASCLR